jgi:cysteine-rich repeat protein
VLLDCGNGVVDAGEERDDGNNVSGDGCEADCIPTCGNGLRDAAEICDGADLAGQSCQTRGFAAGDLACEADCSDFDTDDCVPAPENCQDGVDNDTLVDCLDAPECNAACADACFAPEILTPVGGAATVNGNTTGHADSREI